MTPCNHSWATRTLHRIDQPQTSFVEHHRCDDKPHHGYDKWGKPPLTQIHHCRCFSAAVVKL